MPVFCLGSKIIPGAIHSAPLIPNIMAEKQNCCEGIAIYLPKLYTWIL